jgi:hypothetical protein
MLPIGFVMMGSFVFFMVHFWRFRNPYQIAMVPTVGILINYVVMKRALSKLEALPAPTTRSVSIICKFWNQGLGYERNRCALATGSLEPMALTSARVRFAREWPDRDGENPATVERRQQGFIDRI